MRRRAESAAWDTVLAVPRPPLSKFLTAMLCAMGAILLVASPASSHASVSSTTPADGAVTVERPDYVEIVFNEKVSIADGSARLIDADGTEVVLPQLSNPPEGAGSRARWSLPSDLDRGWYAVAWRAVSEDGHGIQGSFTFYYGDPTVAGQAQRAEQVDDPTRPYVLASHVLRVLSYLAVLLAVGFLAALWAVSGPDVSGLPSLGQALRRASATAAIIGLVLTPMTLLNNALLLNGGSFESLRIIVQIVMQSSSGAALLVRMSALFGLCTAVLLLAEVGTRKVGGVVTVLATGALTASFAMGGHAAVVPWRWVASVAEVLHLGAASAWLGAIPAVAWILWRRSSLSDASIPEIISRFSRVATVSVVMVFVGGAVLSASMLTSPEQLVTTRYGVTLLVKFALVASVGLIGAYNHFVLVPALRRDVHGDQDADGTSVGNHAAAVDDTHDVVLPAMSAAKARTHLRTSLLVEAAFLALVAVATGALTSSAAPAAGGSHLSHLGGSPHGHSGGFDFDVSLALEDLEPRIVQAPLGTGELRLDYLPGRADAENRFRVSVTDASGAERALDGVDISFTQSALGIGPLERSFQRQADGTWILVSRDLGVVGTWNAELLVRLADGSVDTVTLEVTIREARGATGVAP